MKFCTDVDTHANNPKYSSNMGKLCL